MEPLQVTSSAQIAEIWNMSQIPAEIRRFAFCQRD